MRRVQRCRRSFTSSEGRARGERKQSHPQRHVQVLYCKQKPPQLATPAMNITSREARRAESGNHEGKGKVTCSTLLGLSRFFHIVSSLVDSTTSTTNTHHLSTFFLIIRLDYSTRLTFDSHLCWSHLLQGCEERLTMIKLH